MRSRGYIALANETVGGVVHASFEQAHEQWVHGDDYSLSECESPFQTVQTSQYQLQSIMDLLDDKEDSVSQQL